MRIKDNKKNKTEKRNKQYLSEMLTEVSSEKGLTKKQLTDFMTKIALVEAGESLDPKQKQYNNGSGRGLAQWENDQGSNRAVYSIQRTINYYKRKNKKVPVFLENAKKEIEKKGTYDMTNLNKNQQLVVLLGDMRMGKGDLSTIKNGDEAEFNFWRNYWWQGDDQEAPKKKELWDKKSNIYKNKQNYYRNKLFNVENKGVDTHYVRTKDAAGNYYSTNPKKATREEKNNSENLDKEFHNKIEQKYLQNSKKLKTQQNKKNFINSILELTNVQSVNQMQRQKQK